MRPYTGHPLSQPIVECSAPNGECVIGVVVKALWLDDGDFDRDAWFVVETEDREWIKVRGWTVETHLIG
jgi:hypothetical protein